MSRIKMLLDVIEDVRSLGDSLQALADAMASGEPKEEPKKKTRTKAEPKPKAQEPAPAEAEPEKKPLTLEEVRMVLAEKSRAGYTAEVKSLITQHGADRLSDVDPAEYEALLSEAEVLGNGRADRLGSGVRNLFKYSRFYSGSDPQFREGDVFRIIVPLNEAYSYDYKLGQERPDTVDTNFDTIDTIPTLDLVSRNLTTEENVVLELITRDAALTQKQVQNTTGYSLSTVKRIMARLQKEGVITRIGNNRSGKWQVNG